MITKIKQTLLFVTLIFSASQAVAASPLGCLIEPDQIANVGSQVIGVADAILVERGDYVRKGQVLATLKSDIERASVRAAQTRSRLQADIRSAQTSLDLARVTEQRGAVLVKKKFISKQAYDKSAAETSLAEQKLAFAREQLRISNDDLAIARARLKMRAIRSPIDGIVSERFAWPGDRVEEKPLFKIVKTNPLRVEIVVPVEMFGKIKRNDTVSIQPDIPNGGSLLANVVLVDRIIDGASNTFRVRAEIPNPDNAIPSGLRCKASLDENVKSAGTNTPAKIASTKPVTIKKAETNVKVKPAQTIKPEVKAPSIEAANIESKKVAPSKPRVSSPKPTADPTNKIMVKFSPPGKILAPALINPKSLIDSKVIEQQTVATNIQQALVVKQQIKKHQANTKYSLKRVSGHVASGKIRRAVDILAAQKANKIQRKPYVLVANTSEKNKTNQYQSIGRTYNTATNNKAIQLGDMRLDTKLSVKPTRKKDTAVYSQNSNAHYY